MNSKGIYYIEITPHQTKFEFEHAYMMCQKHQDTKSKYTQLHREYMNWWSFLNEDKMIYFGRGVAGMLL